MINTESRFYISYICLKLNNMKNIFKLLFLVLISVNNLNAQTTFEDCGIKYSVTDSITHTVGVMHKATKYGGDIIIPEQVIFNNTTYTVTSILTQAFANCHILNSITLPNSLISIKWEAFAFATALTSIEIPNSVTYVESRAFASCVSVTSLTFGSSVSYIGPCAFWECLSLNTINVEPNNLFFTSIEGVLYNIDTSNLVKYPAARIAESYAIPNSVTVIDAFAFNYCHGISNLEIPNSVTSIGQHAFSYSADLTSISFGNSVASIGDWAFYKAQGIISFSVNPDNPYYSSLDGVLFTKDKRNLIVYPSGKSGTYIIPNTTTTINQEAFAACKNLTALEIPSTMDSIGDRAFTECTALDIITCCALEPPILGSFVFKNLYHNVGLFVPTESVQLYVQNSKWFALGGVIGIENCGKQDSIIIENNEVSVYPNPFNDLLTITCEANDIGGLFELYDLNGKIVLSQFVNSSTQLSCKKLKAGLYFYCITNNGERTIGKITKN